MRDVCRSSRAVARDVQRITLCVRAIEIKMRKIRNTLEFLILLYILTPSIPTTETTHGFCEEDFDEEIACQAQKVQAQGREETREAQSEEASREEARRQKAREEAPQERPS
jgi:hypothetical protein